MLAFRLRVALCFSNIHNSYIITSLLCITRYVTCVHSAVPYEIRYVIEFSSAELADADICAQMDVQVRTQVRLAEETFPTYLTHLRSLSQMNTSMVIAQLRSTVES